MFKSRRALIAFTVLDALLWRQAAAAAVLSPVHIGRLYRSRHRAGRLFKSRRALIAFTVLDALLWRQAAAAAVLSPVHIGRLYRITGHVYAQCAKSSLIRKYLLV
jgi:hypothetical protein